MFDKKPHISLEGELAEIDRTDGTSTRHITELQVQLKRFLNTPNIDPAEALADTWRKDKVGRVWTRDRIAALIAHALKIRKETDALNDEARELFLSVLATGTTPEWFKDFQ
jgi:hypothetical protein